MATMNGKLDTLQLSVDEAAMTGESDEMKKEIL